MAKVQLILVDGMRPDALDKCSNPYIKELLDNSLYTLEARTVMPSVTLPCHMSLFHSVDPDRHGITTNFYMQQVRPIKGIVEQIQPKTSAFFYNWEELEDLTRPGGSMIKKGFFAGHHYGYEKANEKVTEATVQCLKEDAPDFVFTYLGWTDEAGHAHGWMGEEYLRSLDESFACIKKIIDNLPEDYITIVIADHGGHGRTHGTELDEDMKIPVIIYGNNVKKGVIEKAVSIKDIAPTVVKLLGCTNAPEWEGNSIL